MYARNAAALIGHLTKDGALKLDFDDEITRGACVARPPVAAASVPSAAPVAAP
jgi:hypothetical protein